MNSEKHTDEKLKSKNHALHPAHVQAENTAKDYGFNLFEGLSVDKQDITKAKSFKENRGQMKEKTDCLDFDGFLEEKMSVIRAFLDKKMVDLPQPAMISYSGPLEGNPHVKKGSKDHLFNIEIIGNSKSIADAIVIETAHVITKEHYPDDELTIEINSIGDKDSFARFCREFILYYKKHSAELTPACRALVKKDPFALLECEHEQCLVLQNDSPKSMSFLSEPSRAHFREVLEYIESLNIPYNINHTLVGSKNYCSGVVFRILATPESKKKDDKVVKGRTIAVGERYNTLSRKAFGKKEVPAVGAALLVSSTTKAVKVSRKKANEVPRFYFIQLGHDAKLKSLALIEMLRQAKIHVVQALSRDKITSQLAAAEKMGVPYILLLGQKEVMDESVTVRHMNNRSQETVLMTDLVSYLKKLP